MPPPGSRLSLPQIVLIGTLVLMVFAAMAIGALVVGHRQILQGTGAIEQITVPSVLDSSRIARNLEHLRRYGDMAIFTDSAVERSRSQMSMALIITHPSMQASAAMKERVARAVHTLEAALAMTPLASADPSARNRALAQWTLAADDLTSLADELNYHLLK